MLGLFNYLGVGTGNLIPVVVVFMVTQLDVELITEDGDNIIFE